MIRKLLSTASLCLLLSPMAHAQTISAAPSLMNFQGRLATPAGNPLPDGSYSIRFSLWDVASGGSGSNEKWSQTAASVQVKNGAFSVLLNIGANADTILNNNVWLETKIGTDAPLSPRQQIVSVAYALKANTVPDNAITTSKIAAGAVTEPKLASNSVTNAKIANAAVDTAKIAMNTVDNTLLRNDHESLSKVTGGNMTATNTRIGVKTVSPAFDFDINGTFRAAESSYFNSNAFFSGNAVVGSNTSIPNPFSLSRVLSLVGANSGSFPNTSGISYLQSNGTTGWTAGMTGDGNFSFVKHGGGNSRVVVPVLQVNGGSDVAEPFPVRERGLVKPGMVVSIDPGKIGSLRLANRPYDKTVAGIVSGAGGIRTGMTLSQTGTVADGTHPVALTGRVWCYVDADANGGIEAGDLLTTSKTPGYAMKATVARRMQGATIGKAMSSLKRGKGLVLVLVGSH